MISRAIQSLNDVDSFFKMWCEQQLHYSFEKPTLVRENEAANKGSELHLERELETQDYVDVEVETKEDIFAVKLFNLVKSLEELGYTMCSLLITRVKLKSIALISSDSQ